MRLKNKFALITGAAQGIGEATAELFIEEGARVLLTDVNERRGKALADRLGDRADFLRLDVRDAADWDRAEIYIVQKYGRLDVLVNNAGITGFLESNGPFDAEYTDVNSWELVHQVNSTGTMLGCKTAIQLMKEFGGSIINMSSRSGIIGVPEAVAYASSKAAVRNHTKSVALYCASKNYGIRCNSIHPGAIMTPMWDKMLGHGEEKDRILQQIEADIPLGHFGDPIDIAYAVVFLASEESRYVTGTEIHIDGGAQAGSDPSTRGSQKTSIEYME